MGISLHLFDGQGGLKGSLELNVGDELQLHGAAGSRAPQIVQALSVLAEVFGLSSVSLVRPEPIVPEAPAPDVAQPVQPEAPLPADEPQPEQPPAE